jgi:hypothetical protein
MRAFPNDKGVAMAVRIEWRTRGEMDDAILVVDDADNTVRQGLGADPEVLRDFLNNMADLDIWRSLPPVGNDKHNPGAWGELVMARAPTGEVITMDPELFWEGIYLWFRSRGVDPHPMRR